MSDDIPIRLDKIQTAIKGTKTMTLNLSVREMDALEKMAKDQDMSKTAVMRQALRVYHDLKLRAARGERVEVTSFGIGVMEVEANRGEL